MASMAHPTEKKQVAVALWPAEVRALKAVVDGFDSHPGTSDLDNEQSIYVHITLGDYRKIEMLSARLERA